MALSGGHNEGFQRILVLTVSAVQNNDVDANWMNYLRFS